MGKVIACLVSLPFLVLFAAGSALADAQTFVAAKDAWVWSAVPDNNIGNTSVVEIGRTVPKGAQPVLVKRALLHFDIATIPANVTITAATLRLYVERTSADPLALALTAWRLSSPFVEGDGTTGVTWNTQPGVEAAPTDSATMSTVAGQWFEMDVLDVVDAEYESADPTGVWLRVAGTDETTVELRDFGARTRENGSGQHAAQLVVTYSLPTPTPTATATNTPTATPTPDLVPPVITITSPDDGSVMGAASVLVTGTVLDASPLAALSVAGNAMAPSAWFSTTVALSAGANTITVQATDSAGNQSMAAITVRRDQPPVLAAIGSQSAPLGQVLTFTLAATDPDNDGIQFVVEPLPLPGTATLDAATGVFRYTPAVNDAGKTFALTFAASDGVLRDTEAVAITVGAWPTAGTTALSGRLLDANDASGGTTTSIAGVTVRRLPSGPSTTTAADGTFTLGGILPGLQYIEFDGSTATSAHRYGGYRAQLALIPHVTTVLDRPIYLPRIDTTGEVMVDPNATTVVSNPNIGPPPGVTLTIPPHTVKDGNGMDYAGPISISQVPADFTPGALPDALEPGLVITIQPMGLTFATPVPVVFPNVDALRVGSQVNLWSLDHTLGQFFVAGTGQVSANGTVIDTISGGIREASWHFLLPIEPNFSMANTSPGCGGACGQKFESACSDSCSECGGGDGAPCTDGSSTSPSSTNSVGFGSIAQLGTGNVGSGFSLPAHESFGKSRSLTFSYSSIAAHPAPVVSFDATILGIAALPPKVSYSVSTGGTVRGVPIVTETSTLVDGIDQAGRFALPVHLFDLPTGAYPLSLRVSSLYDTARVSAVVDTPLVHVNHRSSPFGSGWTLRGLDRIHVQPDQSVLLVQGNGVSAHFSPAEAQSYETLIEGDDPLAYFRLGEAQLSAGGCQAAREEVSGAFGTYQTTSATDWSCGAPGAIAGDSNTAVYLAGTGPDTNNRQLDLTTLPVAQRQALALAQVDAFTIELWVRYATHELPVVLMGAWNETSFGASQYRLWIDDQGRPVCSIWRLGAGSADEVVGPVSLADDQWHHVACRYDALDAVGDGLEVFVDGQQVAGNPALSGPTNQQWQDARIRCQAGGLKRCGLDNSGSGGCGAACCTGAGDAECQSTKLLDEVAWYGTALSDAQIAAHHLAGSAAEFPAPSGAYLSPDGDTSTLAKNADGSFTRTLRDNGRVEFDAAGRQTARVNRNGQVTFYEYDASDRVFRITEPGNRVTLLDYLGDHLSKVTDPATRETEFEHDSAGNLVRVIFPDGSTRSFGYDGRHLMTAETNGRLLTTERDYDFAGLAAEARLPDGSVRRITPEKAIGLVDPASGLGSEANPAPVARTDEAQATFRDGEGRLSRTVAGALGLPTAVIDAANLTTSYEREADGNVTRVEYPSGQVIRRTYDAKGNVETLTDEAIGGTTTYTYDPITNAVTSIEDAFLETTQIVPDAHGNPLTITTPEGRVVQMTYTSQGLPERVTDVFGTVTKFTYDPITGVLLSILQGENLPAAEQRLTAFTPTAEGYVDLVTDAESRSTEFTYDPLGRVTAELLPGNRLVDFSFDPAGNFSSIVPPDRPQHRFEYSAVNQEEAYRPPSIAGVADPDTDYTYNLAQQPEQVLRPDGSQLTYDYDAAGRLEILTMDRVDPPAQEVHTYTYAPATGLLQSITKPGGGDLAFQYLGSRLATETWSDQVVGSVARTYDPAGRIDAQTVTDGVGTASAVHFAYDDDGLLLRTERPLGTPEFVIDRDPLTGTVVSTTLGVVTDTWTYTAFGELDTYAAQANATVLYSVDYARDRLGRITEKTESIAGEPAILFEYAYDPAGRLWQVRHNGLLVAEYTYDANGNRLTGPNLTTPPLYDDQDRLLTYEDATFTYAASGELRVRTEAGETTTYDYDPLGNLRSVTLPNGPPTTVGYLTDARNRRVGRIVDGLLQQVWLYQDQLNPIAQLTNQNRLAQRFVYGTKANVPDCIVTHDPATGQPTGTLRVISDHLGSIRLIVDSAGNIAQRMEHGEFGNVALDTNPGFQPFGFAGGLSDERAQTSRFGARDYDPMTGRWLTKDPVGFRGGDTSLYAYVFNDPINLLDPSGLQALPPGSGPAIGQIDYFQQCVAGPANQSFPPGASDKFKHCMVSCDICRICGPTISGAAGILKEVQDVFGKGQAELADLAADLAGVKCGQESPAEPCTACCKKAGYSP